MAAKRMFYAFAGSLVMLVKMYGWIVECLIGELHCATAVLAARNISVHCSALLGFLDE